MTFSVNVAADVQGRKINLALPFPQRPSFIELQRAIEKAFDSELQLAITNNNSSNNAANINNNNDYPSKFEISAIQIYNDGSLNGGNGAGEWEILRSCALLTNECQLYAFQRSVIESSFDIPSPRAPRGSLSLALANNGALAAGNIGATTGRSGSIEPLEAYANNNGLDNESIATSSAANAGDAILAGHIQRRGQSPLRPSAAFGIGGTPSAPLGTASTIAGTHAFLRAAAPSAKVTPAYDGSSPAPNPINNSGVVSYHQPSAIDVLNAQSAEVSPTAFSSLITMKQKLFADPSPAVEHKVRVVFDELDVKHKRRIEIGEFRQTLLEMRIALSDSDIKDIFIRADKDQNGTISFVEFEWLASHYPTLVDALYFRLKEAYEERRKRDIIEQRRRVVEEELQSQAAETARLNDIRRQIEQYEAQLLNMEQERKTKEFREKECQSKLGEAKREVDAQRQLRQQREADVAAAKENEKQRHANLLEAQKAVESAQRKVAEMEADLTCCQDKETQLELLLEEARAKTNKARRTLQSGVEEARSWREHETKQSEMFAESQKEVQRSAQHVAAVDSELEALMKFAAASEEQLLAAQRETALAMHRKEQHQTLLTSQNDKSSEHQHILHNINVALEKARNALDSADRELSDFRARRLRIEQQEKPLIDQEVQLRAQRFALEEQEKMHRDEKITFYTNANRSGNASLNPNNGFDAAAMTAAVSASLLNASRAAAPSSASMGRMSAGGGGRMSGGNANASAAVHQMLNNTNLTPNNNGNTSSFPISSPAPHGGNTNNSYMQQQFYRSNSGGRF